MAGFFRALRLEPDVQHSIIQTNVGDISDLLPRLWGMRLLAQLRCVVCPKAAMKLCCLGPRSKAVIRGYPRVVDLA